MEQLDLIADLSAIAASLAVIVTTIFVARQLRLQARNVDNDEKRFLRESLMIVHETLQDPEFLRARREFFDGPYKLEYSKLESQTKRRARFVLSIYALLTRMLLHRAIDEGVYRDYWKNVLIRDWNRMENFISGERLNRNDHRLFGATEELVSRRGKANG